MNSPFDTHNASPPQSHDQLLKLVGELSNKELYTADRDKLITDLAARRFQFRGVIQQITRSYVSDLPTHQNGLTVEGVVDTTETAVQVQFPETLNDLISPLEPGGLLVVDGVLNRWLPGLDRLEFWGSAINTDSPELAAGHESVEPVTVATTLPEDTTGDETAAAHPAPLPPTSGTLSDSPASTAESGGAEEVGANTQTEIAPDVNILPADDVTDPHFAPPHRNPARTAFSQRRSTITSQQISEHVATSYNVTVLQATAAIEAFWSLLSDPRHYDGGRSALEIPFFGRFKVVAGHDHTNLDFASHASSILKRQITARAAQHPQASQGSLSPEQESARQEQLRRLAGQIYQQHSRLPALAMKAANRSPHSALSQVPFEQQLACSIAESAEVDQETALQMAWELIETVCAILAHGQVSIRWSGCGEMIPSRNRGDVTYRFRTYSRFSKTLPKIPGSGKTRRRQKPASSKVHTTRGPSQRSPPAGPIVNVIILLAYVMLIVFTALCLMIPLTGVYGLLNGNPEDTGTAVFAIIIGLAISFVPCRISYSVTRDHLRQRRHR